MYIHTYVSRYGTFKQISVKFASRKVDAKETKLSKLRQNQGINHNNNIYDQAKEISYSENIVEKFRGLLCIVKQVV